MPGARYAGAPTDSIGSEVTLPLGDGQSVTLVKTGSVLQKDGSVVWRGEVAESGERAMLMLWSNALLTGHFVCNGKIFTVESPGQWCQCLCGNGSPPAAGRPSRTRRQTRQRADGEPRRPRPRSAQPCGRHLPNPPSPPSRIWSDRF